MQLAVRRLPDEDFARIVQLGLPEDLERQEATRYEPEGSEVAEKATIFERPVLERLTRRPFRDVAFRRKVREAYHFYCAMSGLMLRNGGRRPEVQAIYIRPVEHNGSGSVRIWLSLSGRLLWMFDCGLISVADDGQTILVSRNKVPGDAVERLLRPDGKIWMPEAERNWPHPANLA